MDTEHFIHNEDGKLIRKFKVTSDCITFRDMEVSDSGVYTISCHGAKGLEGKASFELKVTPPDASTAKSQPSFYSGEIFILFQAFHI